MPERQLNGAKPRKQPSRTRSSWLMIGLALALFGGLVFGLFDAHRPTQAVRQNISSPGERASRSFKNGLVVGLIFWLIFGSSVLTIGLVNGLTLALSTGLTFGLIVGLIAGLQGGLSAPPLQPHLLNSALAEAQFRKTTRQSWTV